MSFDRSAMVPRLLNLALPGGGLIAVGAVWRGTLIGLTFLVLLNAVIVFGLIIPDAIPPISHAYDAGVVAAAVAYVGAQFWLGRILRRREHGHEHTLRRKLLREVVECLERGDAPAAVELLRPHEALTESDLLLAFRFAQALHAATRHAQPALRHDAQRTTGAVSVASGAALRIAWQRVRRLDTHRIYRVEIESAIAEVESQATDAD